MLAMVGYWPEARRSLELPCLEKPCDTAPTAAMGFEQRGLQQHGFGLVLPVSCCCCWRHVAEFAGQRQVCYTGDWHPLLSQALLESARCSGEGHELEGHWSESLSIERFGAMPSARWRVRCHEIGGEGRHPPEPWTSDKSPATARLLYNSSLLRELALCLSTQSSPLVLGLQTLSRDDLVMRD